jgi:Xaa-Pro aminopeptidase
MLYLNKGEDPMKQLHENRIKKLSEAIYKKGLDGAVIIQNADIYYFTGTVPQGVLVIDNNGEYLFGIIKPYERAVKESPLKNKIGISSLREVSDLLKKLNLGQESKLGMELDVVPYQIVKRIQQSYEKLEIVNISREIRGIRSVKDAGEIASIKHAGNILSETFEYLKKIIKPGLNELELAVAIESFMRLRGHQGFLRMRKFNLEMYYGALGVGTSTCQPTMFDGPVGVVGLYPAVPYFTGNSVISKGDTVMVDLMCGVDGYMADGTRNYHIAPYNDEVIKVHGLAVNIQDMIADLMKPGAIAEDLWFKARDMAINAGYENGFMGYGKNSVKFVGHGVGLEVDELPVLAPGFKSEIKEGQVVAVEPKFFGKTWAAGIENTYIITKNSAQRVIPIIDDIILI